MNRTFAWMSALMLTVAVMSGCATKPRQLMPTPLVYQAPNGRVLFEQKATAQQRPEVDLLFITNRAAEDDPESRLPYGQTRRKGMAFGSAEVRMVPAIDWETLKAQSRLAEELCSILVYERGLIELEQAAHRC